MTQLREALKREPLVALAIVAIVANAAYSALRGDVDAATAIDSAWTAIGALVARALVSPKWKTPKPFSPGAWTPNADPPEPAPSS